MHFAAAAKINKNRLSIYLDLEYIKPKRAYGGIQGLKPFPRTGRSDPDLANWDNAINAISAFDDEYDGKSSGWQMFHHGHCIRERNCGFSLLSAQDDWNSYFVVYIFFAAAEYSPLEIKRAQNSLFAFPRVGRGSASRYLSKASDASQETIKRGGVGGGSGMWFGPRLGRVQKRSVNPDHNV